jgi:hypothetical protein
LRVGGWGLGVACDFMGFVVPLVDEPRGIASAIVTGFRLPLQTASKRWKLPLQMGRNRRKLPMQPASKRCKQQARLPLQTASKRQGLQASAANSKQSCALTNQGASRSGGSQHGRIPHGVFPPKMSIHASFDEMTQYDCYP